MPVHQGLEGRLGGLAGHEPLQELPVGQADQRPGLEQRVDVLPARVCGYSPHDPRAPPAAVFDLLGPHRHSAGTTEQLRQFFSGRSPILPSSSILEESDPVRLRQSSSGPTVVRLKSRKQKILRHNQGTGPSAATALFRTAGRTGLLTPDCSSVALGWKPGDHQNLLRGEDYLDATVALVAVRPGRGHCAFVATLIKVVRAIARGLADQPEWGEAAGFAAAVFAMGFVCGIVVWAGRGLYRRFGMVGDAVVGVAVMVVFFVCCMLLFEPELLGTKFSSGGVPMLGLAVVIGLICGPWFGRDLRKEFASSEFQTDPPAQESETEDEPFEMKRPARDDGFRP